MLGRVAHEASREGREVEVVVDEQLLGGHVLQDLDERAIGTEGDIERIPRFRERELSGRSRASGSGMSPEREEDLELATA